MSQLILTKPLEDLSNVDSEELRVRLSESLWDLHSKISDAAWIVAELDKRGVDLTSPLPDGKILPGGIIKNLRKIACGSLLPEAYVRFMGTQILPRIERMPAAKQKEIIDLENVSVMTTNGDHIQLPLQKLNKFQVNQVLGPEGVRDDVSQVQWIRQQDEKTRRRAIAKTARNSTEVTTQKNPKGIKVGEHFISAVTLVGYVLELLPPSEIDKHFGHILRRRLRRREKNTSQQPSR